MPTRWPVLPSNPCSTMLSALFILRSYRALGVEPARKVAGQWCAVSQYDYAFARAYDRNAAVRHVIHFYQSNPHLLLQ